MTPSPPRAARYAIPASAEIRDELYRLNGRRVMLAFSRGKDSIAAWLALRDDGCEVIPVHYETVPGLQFVRESIVYYERFFGVPITVVPHPNFFRALDESLFQPRSRAVALAQYPFHRRIEYRDVFDAVAAERGCGLWYATGNRAADSNTRRLALMTHGALVQSQKKAHVVWDWRAERMRDEFRQAGVRLPVDYHLFGRSFDGLGVEYLHAIAQHFPEDYRRILEFFPLADVELFRDRRMRHAG